MYLKRLKDLREDFDKKQHDIAEFLNITRQQYSLYELGKRDIPLNIFVNLQNITILPQIIYWKLQMRFPLI